MTAIALLSVAQSHKKTDDAAGSQTVWDSIMVSLRPGSIIANHDAITDKAFEQDWALDAAGNWEGFDQDTDGDSSWDLEQTRQHNAVNETGTIGATTGTNWADPVHDAAGNMTSMPKPSDLGNSISGKYDAWNRLVEVSDGGVLVAKFRYDGEGRRILKMFDSDSPADPDGLDTYEHIFLSGQQVIETREGSGDTPAQAETLQPKYQNIWSPRYIDSLILRDENTDADGLCDDSRVYYLADANFNVTSLVDTNGNVVERYLYLPYGEATVLDSDFSSDADGLSDYSNTTLYTGRTLDVATGLMYYRARYYHGGLGRFVNRDPIEYETEDFNLFRYVEGRPLSTRDPFGFDSLDDFFRPPPIGSPWWPPGSPWGSGPFPPIGACRRPIANAKTTTGFNTWLGPFLGCCKSKKDRWTGVDYIAIGQRTDPGVMNFRGHVFCGLPAWPMQVMAAGGSATCIIVAIRCGAGIALFHFAPGDSPQETFSMYNWNQFGGCKAVVCGGDDSNASNCLAVDVLDGLEDEGISDVQVSDWHACGIRGGAWFLAEPPQ